MLPRGESRARIVDWRLVRLALTERRRLAAIVGIGLLVSGTYVLQGVLIARVLARIFEGAGFSDVTTLIVLASVTAVGRAGLLWAQEGISAAASLRIQAKVRQRLYEKLFALGPGWAGGERSGEIQRVLVDSVAQLDMYFRLFLGQVIVSAITAVAVTAVVLLIDPVVGAAVAVFALVVTLAPHAEFRAVGRRVAFWTDNYDPLAAEYVDNLQGMATLKAFGASKRQGAELRTRAAGLRDAAVAVESTSGYFWGLMMLGAGAGEALSLGIGALRFADGAMTTGQLLLVLLLVHQCFRPAREIHDALHRAVWGMYAAGRVFLVLDARPEVADPDTPLRSDSKRGPPAIEFENVTFRYPRAHRPAVEGLSFAVPAGRRVALVGRSGAGKTTALALLMRFFDPHGGTIRIDGVDIRQMSLEELRRMIAVVPQETFLFHGTVRENLLLGRPGATDAELEAAARSARAHEFIAQLPQGYDTVIGERGLKLSGGERQRIAIARAVLKDTPILVLDEATSSVDVASEAAIQRALDDLSRNRTTLVIAHRLSTVQAADEILVIDAGRLVERGRHADLLERGDVYSRLVAAQEAAS
jgi:ABC-type multidrug transport system fused ATPase/permease subunit